MLDGISEAARRRVSEVPRHCVIKVEAWMHLAYEAKIWAWMRLAYELKMWIQMHLAYEVKMWAQPIIPQSPLVSVWSPISGSVAVCSSLHS